MTFTGDDRGQSIQIGAVLLFGFLIIGLTIYQATVVPQQNSQVEYSHSLAVQEDLQQLRNSIVRITAGGEPLPQTVALGTSYPTRIVAVNPGPPSGTLQTTGQYDVNVGGVDRSVCPGQSSPAGAQSRLLTYRDGYNEYAQAPLVVYENTVVHKQFVDPDTASTTELERGTIPMSSQRLVDGDRIHLLTVVGNYDESGAGVATVEPRAGETRRTAVTDPVLTLPTRMHASEWRALLPASNTTVSSGSSYTPVGSVQIQFDGRYVVSCTPVSFDGYPSSGLPPGTKQASLVTEGAGMPSLKQGQLKFPIQNTGDNQVTITGFAMTNRTIKRIRADGSDDEVIVSPRGAFRTGYGNISDGPVGTGYTTDGTEYDLIEDSEYGGQTAVLQPGGTADLTFQLLRNETGTRVGYGNLEFTDSGTATIAVTLRFGDGSKKTFYFRPR